MSETTKPGGSRPGPGAGDDRGDGDDRIDEGVEETFPASDPPATGGSTGPNDPVVPPAPLKP